MTKEILRQQVDIWCDSHTTRIFRSLLNDKRERLLKEMKFATQKYENPEITVRLVAKLAELDEVIAYTKNADTITEHGSRGIISTGNG
jgi:catalase